MAFDTLENKQRELWKAWHKGFFALKLLSKPSKICSRSFSIAHWQLASWSEILRALQCRVYTIHRNSPAAFNRNAVAFGRQRWVQFEREFTGHSAQFHTIESIEWYQDLLRTGLSSKAVTVRSNETILFDFTKKSHKKIPRNVLKSKGVIGKASRKFLLETNQLPSFSSNSEALSSWKWLRISSGFSNEVGI